MTLNFLKNERVVRRHDPDAPEKVEHDRECRCFNCPPRCPECGNILKKDDEDICEICDERARFFDLGL